MHKWLSAKETTCTIFQWGISLFSHWWLLREPRIIPPWDLHVPFTCIIGCPAILFLAIMLHNVCFILHLSLHKMMSRKEYMYWQNRKDRVSKYIRVRASGASERAIFGVFNSFTVKKVSFFTINVKFKGILSSKSGGMFVQVIPPPQKVGGGGGIHPPSPPPPGFTPVGVSNIDTFE